MTSSTVAHAGLIVSLSTRLFNHLQEIPCKVFIFDLKVQIAQNIFYPDVVVNCESQENDGMLCQNSKFIIEVLSNSTFRKHRHIKRSAYQEIPRFKEYILVSQEEKHIEIYRRAEDWKSSVYIDGLVELPRLI